MYLIEEQILQQTEEEQDHLEDDVNVYCPRCQELRGICHSKQFCSYCIAIVDSQFREMPLSMSRRNYSKFFTDAYNRAFGYRKFQENQKLMPHAYYYPPACLKVDLHNYICGVEGEIGNHISG